MHKYDIVVEQDEQGMWTAALFPVVGGKSGDEINCGFGSTLSSALLDLAVVVQG